MELWKTKGSPAALERAHLSEIPRGVEIPDCPKAFRVENLATWHAHEIFLRSGSVVTKWMFLEELPHDPDNFPATASCFFTSKGTPTSCLCHIGLQLKSKMQASTAHYRSWNAWMIKDDIVAFRPNAAKPAELDEAHEMILSVYPAYVFTVDLSWASEYAVNGGKRASDTSKISKRQSVSTASRGAPIKDAHHEAATDVIDSHAALLPPKSASPSPLRPNNTTSSELSASHALTVVEEAMRHASGSPPIANILRLRNSGDRKNDVRNAVAHFDVKNSPNVVQHPEIRHYRSMAPWSAMSNDVTVTPRVDISDDRDVAAQPNDLHANDDSGRGKVRSRSNLREYYLPNDPPPMSGYTYARCDGRRGRFDEVTTTRFQKDDVCLPDPLSPLSLSAARVWRRQEQKQKQLAYHTYSPPVVRGDITSHGAQVKNSVQSSRVQATAVRVPRVLQSVPLLASPSFSTHIDLRSSAMMAVYAKSDVPPHVHTAKPRAFVGLPNPRSGAHTEPELGTPPATPSDFSPLEKPVLMPRLEDFYDWDVVSSCATPDGDLSGVCTPLIFNSPPPAVHRSCPPNRVPCRSTDAEQRPARSDQTRVQRRPRPQGKSSHVSSCPVPGVARRRGRVARAQSAAARHFYPVPTRQEPRASSVPRLVTAPLPLSPRECAGAKVVMYDTLFPPRPFRPPRIAPLQFPDMARAFRRRADPWSANINSGPTYSSRFYPRDAPFLHSDARGFVETRGENIERGRSTRAVAPQKPPQPAKTDEPITTVNAWQRAPESNVDVIERLPIQRADGFHQQRYADAPVAGPEAKPDVRGAGSTRDDTAASPLLIPQFRWLSSEAASLCRSSLASSAKSAFSGHPPHQSDAMPKDETRTFGAEHALSHVSSTTHVASLTEVETAAGDERADRQRVSENVLLHTPVQQLPTTTTLPPHQVGKVASTAIAQASATAARTPQRQPFENRLSEHIGNVQSFDAPYTGSHPTTTAYVPGAEVPAWRSFENRLSEHIANVHSFDAPYTGSNPTTTAHTTGAEVLARRSFENRLPEHIANARSFDALYASPNSTTTTYTSGAEVSGRLSFENRLSEHIANVHSFDAPYPGSNPTTTAHTTGAEVLARRSFENRLPEHIANARSFDAAYAGSNSPTTAHTTAAEMREQRSSENRLSEQIATVQSFDAPYTGPNPTTAVYTSGAEVSGRLSFENRLPEHIANARSFGAAYTGSNPTTTAHTTGAEVLKRLSFENHLSEHIANARSFDVAYTGSNSPTTAYATDTEMLKRLSFENHLSEHIANARSFDAAYTGSNSPTTAYATDTEMLKRPSFENHLSEQVANVHCFDAVLTSSNPITAAHTTGAEVLARRSFENRLPEQIANAQISAAVYDGPCLTTTPCAAVAEVPQRLPFENRIAEINANVPNSGIAHQGPAAMVRGVSAHQLSVINESTKQTPITPPVSTAVNGAADTPPHNALVSLQFSASHFDKPVEHRSWDAALQATTENTPGVDLRQEFSIAEQASRAREGAALQPSDNVQVLSPEQNSAINHASQLVESEDLAVVARMHTEISPPNDVRTHRSSTIASESTQQVATAPLATTVGRMASEDLILASYVPPHCFVDMRSSSSVADVPGPHEAALNAEPGHVTAEGSTRVPSAERAAGVRPPFCQDAPPKAQVPTPLLATVDAHDASSAHPGVPHTQSSFNEHSPATVLPTYVAHNTPSGSPTRTQIQQPATAPQEHTTWIAPTYQHSRDSIACTYQENTSSVAPNPKDTGASIASSFDERTIPNTPVHQDGATPISPSNQTHGAAISLTYQAPSVPLAPPTRSPVQQLPSVPKERNARSVPGKNARTSSRSLVSQRTSSVTVQDQPPSPRVKTPPASSTFRRTTHSWSREHSWKTGDAATRPTGATQRYFAVAEKKTPDGDPAERGPFQTQTASSSRSRSQSLGASNNSRSNWQVRNAFTSTPHPGFQLLPATQNAHNSPRYDARTSRHSAGKGIGFHAGVTAALTEGDALSDRALQSFSRRTPLNVRSSTRSFASLSPTGGTQRRESTTPPRVAAPPHAVTPSHAGVPPQAVRPPHAETPPLRDNSRTFQACTKVGTPREPPANIEQRQPSPDQQRTTLDKNQVSSDKSHITSDRNLSSSNQRLVGPRQRQTSPHQTHTTSAKTRIASDKSRGTTDKNMSSAGQRRTEDDCHRASPGRRQNRLDRPWRTNTVKDSFVEPQNKRTQSSSRHRSPEQAKRVEQSRATPKTGATVSATQSSAPLKAPKRKAKQGAAAAAMKFGNHDDYSNKVSVPEHAQDRTAADRSSVHFVVGDVEKEEDRLDRDCPAQAAGDGPSIGRADKMRHTSADMWADKDNATLAASGANDDGEESTNDQHDDSVGLSHAARRMSAEQRRFSHVAAAVLPHPTAGSRSVLQRKTSEGVRDLGDEVTQTLQLAAENIELTRAPVGRRRTRDLSHHSPRLVMSARNLTPSGTNMALRKSLFLRERHLNVTSNLEYSHKADDKAGTKRLSHEWPVGIYATTNGEGVLVERKGHGTYKVSMYLVGSTSDRVLESKMEINGDQCTWGPRMVAKRDPPDFYWTDKVKPARDKSWFYLEGDAILALLPEPPGPEQGLAFLRLAVWYFLSRNDMRIVARTVSAMKDRPKGPFDVAVLEHVVWQGTNVAIRAAVRALQGETVMHQTLLKALEICPELGMDLIQTAPPAESKEITELVCSFQEPALIEPAVNALIRLNGTIDAAYMDKVLQAHIGNPLVVGAVAPFVDDVSWCSEIYQRYADHKDVGPAACRLVSSSLFLQKPNGVRVAKRAISCLQSDSVEVQKSAAVLLATWMQANDGAIKFLKQHTPIIKSIVHAARNAEDPLMTRRVIECLSFFSEKEVIGAGGAGVLARKLLLEPSPGRRARKENANAISR